MKQAVTVLFGACCLLLFLAVPSHAVASESALPWMVNASMPGTCSQAREVSAKDAPPIFAFTCSLQVECADSSVISCNGTTTCQTSPDGRCVICDGNTAGCCPQTCCESCEQSYNTCLDNCDLKCNLCNTAYNHCVNNCTGGCF
jgi:hypothetical protein